MADANEPDLRVRESGQQARAGRHDIVGDFKRTAINIDRGNFSVVATFQLGPDVVFIDFPAPMSVLFFAVLWLAVPHGLPPVPAWISGSIYRALFALARSLAAESSLTGRDDRRLDSGRLARKFRP
jgi:hypothetical protein